MDGAEIIVGKNMDDVRKHINDIKNTRNMKNICVTKFMDCNDLV
jgi:hypothetical protein